MDSKNTKLIVVKLDDESSPLMKDYVDSSDTNIGEVQEKTPEKPNIPLPDIVKPNNPINSINFDELSFSHKLDMAPKPSLVIPMNNTQVVPFSRPKPPIQDFSLLAASREVKEEDKLKNNDVPSFYNKPKPALPPINNTFIKSKPKKVRIVPPFKNEAEDGYKIGYLPSVKQSDVLSKMPKKPSSLSKMETLLGIKAKVTGR